jgi:hypothetical protein
MAEAATKYAQAFVDAGRPVGFVDRLRGAAQALNGAILLRDAN